MPETIEGGPQSDPDGGATPDVGIAIITRDRADELAVTIDHLKALPESPPIVVVDNASNGPVPTFEDDSRVRLIRAPRNMGAAARNLAVASLPNRYVAFSDDDSWWAPGALSRACALMDQHASIGAVASRVLVGPDHREDPVCALMAASPLPVPPGAPGPLVMGFVACGCVVRREAFLAAGGFEERLGVGGEEDLFAIDLARLGWDIVYAGDVVAHHHPSRQRDPAARRAGQLRNALWTAWLRRPPASAAAKTLRLVQSGLRDAEGRRGILAAVQGIAWVAQGRRRVTDRVEAALRLLD